MKIDNLKLRTKAMIPLLVMSLAVFGIVGFGAYRLDSLARSAGEIIAHRDKAAILVARATGTTMMAPYSVFGALVYDGSSPEGRTAQSDFSTEIDRVNSLLDSATQYLPDYASTFASFRTSFTEMVEKAKKPVAIGEDSPGLAAGKDLKPEELDKLAEGAREVAEVDAQARKLSASLVAVSDTMINENARSATEMARQSQFALIALIAAGLLSALIAGALTVWISTVKTARPLAALSRRMDARSPLAICRSRSSASIARMRSATWRAPCRCSRITRSNACASSLRRPPAGVARRTSASASPPSGPSRMASRRRSCAASALGSRRSRRAIWCCGLARVSRPRTRRSATTSTRRSTS